MAAEEATSADAYRIGSIGAVLVFGVFVISFDLAGVFSAAGLVGYAIWNVVYVTLAVTFFLALQDKRRSSL